METWEAKSLIHLSAEGVLTGIIMSNDSQVLEALKLNCGKRFAYLKNRHQIDISTETSRSGISQCHY